MARDYDTQLLESVAVRRRRLRDAVVFGPGRARRSFDESLTKVVAGLCVAAVLCAGTVGWSFLQSRLATQKKQQQQAQQAQAVPPDGGAAPVPARWVGARVTFVMLRNALVAAQVPSSLYVLPGQPRPPAFRTSSYYVLAPSANGFSVGIVEYDQGRVGAEFPTEDEASRWLYGELVVKAPVQPPVPAQREPVLYQQGSALAADARAKVAAAGGSTTYLLQQGQVVDQFGQESGSVIFPYAMPFGQRGLRQSARATADPRTPLNYSRYRVTKPFQVTATLSAPTAVTRGGGVRFTLNAGLFPRPPALPSIRWLLRNGYVERLAVSTIPR